MQIMSMRHLCNIQPVLQPRQRRHHAFDIRAPFRLRGGAIRNMGASEWLQPAIHVNLQIMVVES